MTNTGSQIEDDSPQVKTPAATGVTEQSKPQAPEPGVTGVKDAADANKATETTADSIVNESVSDGDSDIASDVSNDDAEREKFIPLTRFAIMSKMTEPRFWNSGEADDAGKFFRYLAAWRHQTYNARLLKLKEAYMPFSPDRDTIQVLDYTDAQMTEFQGGFIERVTELLEQANYTHVTMDRLEEIFSQQSIYNLDLEVDLTEFEELVIFSRGEMIETKERRTWKKLFLGMETYEIPRYQRLFLLLKLKPEERRIDEIMAAERRKNDGKAIERKKAEKILAKNRSMLPPGVCCEHIYLKLFKNIPTTDLEMMFPNTMVRFRPFDKLKLGLTAGGGTIASIVGTAGKLLLITTNPIKAIGALIGIIAVVGRQIMKFFHQRNEYMMVLAQNLYFHNLADNRGALTLLADRAEEVKEEMLLYSFMAKEAIARADLPALQNTIEEHLSKEFGVKVDFDIMDALQRLLHDGVVTENNGRLTAMRPKDGCAHIDAKWAAHLDKADFIEAGPTENV